jgi:hypothetical protein
MSILLDLRFIVERFTGGTVDNEWFINVCNDAQAEFALNINIQDADQISLTTSDLEYTLPTGLKIINRLWLQSNFDAGIDKEFKWPYRTYKGKIIFTQPWVQTDTLNIDYYRHMTYFTSMDDEIDIEERFNSLYTSYGQREYYDRPEVRAAIGESQARKEWEKHNARYLNIQQQVISYYNIQNEPVSVNERW